MAPSVSQTLYTDNEYPELDDYSRPPQTKEDLDWAPLVEIDISRFNEPGEKERLAAQLNDAVRHVGFWIVTGHGISDTEVKRQLQIANAFFHLPMAEKVKVPINLGDDLNWGYREPTRNYGETGLKEAVETYELHKDIEPLKDVKIHPFVKRYWSEIAPFHRKLFERVAVPLYKLIAIILELPEDYFVDMNQYDKRSEDWLRWMLHPPRSREHYDKVAEYAIGGHTDQSSLTLLFEQHVAGLQMLTKDNTWKWVKPVPGGITINAGELFSHLTKGYVKATIHRVHAPVDDQLQYERLGLIYFSLLNDDVDVRPCPSPLLRRLGMLSDEDFDLSKDYPTSVEYTRNRMKARHHVKSFAKRDMNRKFELKGLEAKASYD